MANGKFSNGKRANLKPVALLLAIALLVGTAVGGTLAWLTDKTNEVKNVFTVGNIDIDLNETKNDFKMIPGFTIDKDPKVTVKANSEKSYVFVEVVKSSNYDQYMEHTIDPRWTLLKTEGLTSVYYLVQDATTADVVYSVLAGDQVKVKDTVTKQMMDDIAEDKVAEPTLTFTAYAVQYYKTNGVEFGAEAAWAEAK